MRVWRYGDPVARRPRPVRDLTGQRFGSLVVVELVAGRPTKWRCACDCGGTVDVLPGSLTRAGRGQRACGDRAAHRRRVVVAYGAAHERVRAERGDAAAHWCVDCGRQAAHWCYDHADPRELVSPGQGAYSLDVEHYVPRCVPCHKRVDLAQLAGRTLSPPTREPVQDVLF